MTSIETVLQKLETQASEMVLRAHSNPDDLGFAVEREAIANLLRNQVEIVKAILIINPDIKLNLEG
jgi:hypothetical protein